MTSEQAPLLANKDYEASSLFEPANLLREARRQRALPSVPVPRVAVLDPDGDIVRYLAATGRGRRHAGWACYHTEMWTVDLEGVEVASWAWPSARRSRCWWLSNSLRPVPSC